MNAPLLQLEDVTRQYPQPRERLWQKPALVHALRGVSLHLHSGRSLGVVGESGSGKSTLARLAMGLEPPSSGRVSVLGRDLNALSPSDLRHARRDFQMVFQDPYGSLDPRQTVTRIVGEPLAVLGQQTPAAMREQAAEVLAAVGLRRNDLDKYPHEFSGGQRQRISIARALATEADFLVCDEPTSALDVSVQAQILNLMRRLQDQFGLTYLFISHNLSVVRHMSDQIAIMYLGRFVEVGPAEQVFSDPRHPYTRLLLETIPNVENPIRDRRPMSGEVPSPIAPPPGCPFHPRCPMAEARCQVERPQLRGDARLTACHLV